MTDERIMAAFRAFDVEVEPDAGFAERLFGTLVEGLEFGTMPDPSFRGRLLRALGIGPLPTGTRALRLAYVVAMLGLLLALAWATLVIASHLRTAPTPAELVQQSQQVYEHPPAFSVTYRGPSGNVTIAADGAGTWRVEETAEAQGTYWLWDGADRLGHFDPDTLRWTVGTSKEVGFPGPPGPLAADYTWGTGVISDADPVRHVISCTGAEILAEGTVLGHATDHLRCADIDTQYWLDRETHLILRMEAGPGNPGWSGAQPGTAVLEATAFDVGPQPAAAFDWAGPEVAPSPSGRILEPASDYRLTSLAFGSAMPSWGGPLMVGGRFEGSSLLGRPAVIWFWAGVDCRSCQDDRVDSLASDAARMGDAVRVVIVVAAEPTPGLVAKYFESRGFKVPVIYDWDGAVRRPFDLKFGEVALVFDATGHLVDERDWPPTLPELEAIADAFGSPSASPAPSPSP